MKGMIMAAGVGSRLHPLTEQMPKPMVQVGGIPLMENIINLLREHGVRQLVANLHHYPDKITSYFGDGADFGVNLQYSYEPNLLGTAGGVKNNQHLLDATFVVISGDALTDLNLSEFLRVHREKNALATIALKPMDAAEVNRFGVVTLDGETRITGFQEKPSPEEALSNLVNTGIYIFEPEIFDFIPEKTFYDFGKDLFPRLAAEKRPFYGYITGDYWCDVGTVDAYNQSLMDVKAGRIGLARGVERVTPGGQAAMENILKR